jgi:hypothetical protein
MLRTDFAKKCIIVQFLGIEKTGKGFQRRVRRGAEKRLKEEQRRKNPSEDNNVQPWMHGCRGLKPVLVRAKSFICITINHRSL